MSAGCGAASTAMHFRATRRRDAISIPAKLHTLNHKGKYFSVKGPLGASRPPQGYPVIVQAGTSEPARKLSARVADVVFTAQSAIEDAKAFYADVKARMQQHGRHPDDMKVMPGVAMYIGRSQQEAEDKFEQLNALIPLRSRCRGWARCSAASICRVSRSTNRCPTSRATPRA